jgi:hypothetical protein
MMNKSYSIIDGILVEDTAPVVSVANGVIDTSEPVVSKKQQKKIVNKNRLKSFKEFCEETSPITEEILNEVLDSEFEVHRDHEREAEFNSLLGDQIHPAHTKVMHSQHMLANGHSVIKFMRPAGEFSSKTVEYHFHNRNGEFHDHQLDKKSMLHAIKIIHDDAVDQLNQHRVIKLQSETDDQHDVYMRLAKRLAAKTGKSVRDAGYTKRLDGGNDARTCVVEDVGTFPKRVSMFDAIAKNIRIRNQLNSNN